jgi:hypothetical protein
MLAPNVAMAYPVLPKFVVPGATFSPNVEFAADSTNIMLLYANSMIASFENMKDILFLFSYPALGEALGGIFL